MRKQRDISPSPEPRNDDQPSIVESQQSRQFLASKHLIPPPLTLLPKLKDTKPKSLLPMLSLPSFVGIIPGYQPLQPPINMDSQGDSSLYNWIGEAFDRIVYRKYEETSYSKIDNIEENWNIWACDLMKLASGQALDSAVSEDNLKPFYTPTSPTDFTLVFQSRFQSGNLSIASKVNDNQYNLLMQNDINTSGYAQWFFFKVSNNQSGQTVRFNILNFTKNSHLYREGMKIVSYSKHSSEKQNLSWHRCGQNICYYQNGYSKSAQFYQPYYTLSFEYTFDINQDEVYFAYNYPYTYTNLQTYIQKIEAQSLARSVCVRSLLCKTLANNRIDILTITQDLPEQDYDKDVIIVTARIHPGQTVSSYVCQGIIDYLLSSKHNARKLRQNFIFKIIPMLNPDGVIHGNYRTNLTGHDLNSRWANPSKLYHPEIYHLRKLITTLSESNKVALFCDIHGHSSKKNAFIYGCHNSTAPRKGKEFPLLISRLFKGFSFKDCSFISSSQEEGTCRTVLSKQLGHSDIFALQSSFCGPEYENIHFTVKHFQQLGQKFCESLLVYFETMIEEKQFDAALKDQLQFPSGENISFKTVPDYHSLRDFSEIDITIFEERVNSENSQGSEPQIQSETLLQEKTIRKYLQMQKNRPSTTSRSSMLFRSKSKDVSSKRNIFNNMDAGLGNYFKSISPPRRKELYQPPVQQPKDKMRITMRKSIQKKQIQQKMFEPVEFIPLQQRYRMLKSRSSGSKVSGYESEKLLRRKGIQDSQKVNVVFTKKGVPQAAFGSQDLGKTANLRNFIKDQLHKRQRRNSEFVIRKNPKPQIVEESNKGINLFKSVLSSLKKGSI